MLGDVLQNSIIKQILTGYSKDTWNKCIQACLLYGAQMIQKKYPFGLSIDQLCQISGLEAPIRKSRSQTKSRTPKFKSKSQGTSIKSTSSTEKKVPRYLQQVQSKIKEEVKRDITTYRSQATQVSSSRPISNQKQTHQVKEPKTCSYADAQSLIHKLKTSASSPQMVLESNNRKEPGNVLKIAEEFLSNPISSYLTRQSSQKQTSQIKRAPKPALVRRYKKRDN